MKKIFIVLLISFTLTSIANADTIDCILVKRGEKILIQEGKNCNIPY